MEAEERRKVMDKILDEINGGKNPLAWIPETHGEAIRESHKLATAWEVLWKDIEYRNKLFPNERLSTNLLFDRMRRLINLPPKDPLEELEQNLETLRHDLRSCLKGNLGKDSVQGRITGINDALAEIRRLRGKK